MRQQSRSTPFGAQKLCRDKGTGKRVQRRVSVPQLEGTITAAGN